MRRESRPVNRATHYHKCPRDAARPTRKSVSQIARVGLCHLPTVSFYRGLLPTRACPSKLTRRSSDETESRPSDLLRLRSVARVRGDSGVRSVTVGLESLACARFYCEFSGKGIF